MVYLFDWVGCIRTSGYDKTARFLTLRFVILVEISGIEPLTF